MGKEEELFGQLDLDSLSNDQTDDSDMVDVNEFTKDPEAETEETEEPEVETPDSKKETKKDEDPDEGTDTSIFENIEPSDSDDSINDDPSADNSSSPIMQSLASTLLAEGLIDLEEGEKVESAKDLVDKWRKKMLDNEFSDLNPEQKIYLESLRNGIPEEEVKQNLNNQAALNSITMDMINNEDNEELRVTLISQSLIANGMDEAKALRSAKRTVETGDDVEEAIDAYKSLKQVESTRLANENARLKELRAEQIKKQEENLSTLKDKILKKDEFIPGFKVNSTTKEKIFKNMTEIAGYDNSGNPINAITAERMKDPEKFATIESFLFTYTNGYTDFSKFKNTVKSNAIDELDKKLRDSNTGGGSPKGIISSSQKGLLAALDFNTRK